MASVTELVDFLEKSGTGADKLAKIRELLRGNANAKAGDFLQMMIDAGLPDGTVSKARRFLTDPKAEEAKIEAARMEAEADAAKLAAPPIAPPMPRPTQKK